MMPAAVVVGASGGIGGALAHRLRQDYRVIALSRRPVSHPDWLPVDVLDEASIAAAARQLPAPLARIVVATGRLGTAPEKSMRALSLNALTESFALNAAAPALLAKHLLPLTPRDQPSVFAVLSARVGSIGDNHLGGWYGYRAGKAALNMLVRTLAIEHGRTRPQGICVALHPGTVDTALSKPFQSGVADGKLFTPAMAADALVTVMDGLKPQDTGGFFAWDGAAIPW